MAARFPQRRSADGNLLPRPACRAGVPWDSGPFGQGLTHAQQGHDVPQGLRRPGAFGHPEQRLDACPHILPVVLPAPVKQPGVSEPRVHVRDEDVLYRDLELRDGVVVDRDVQPLRATVAAPAPCRPRKRARPDGSAPRSGRSAVWFSSRISKPASGAATKGKLNFSRRPTSLARRTAMLRMARNSTGAAYAMTAAAASACGSSDLPFNDVLPP